MTSLGRTVGFIGLGNMGAALAANLVRANWDVVGHDAAGTKCAPRGVRWADGAAEVARLAETVVTSLPDGAACRQVAESLAKAEDRRTTHVVDVSTVGIDAAAELAGLLAGHGIAYVDSPVSGGVDGARNRTLMVMYAGEDAPCRAVLPVLEGLSDVRRRVGRLPGQAQAMKLANNFLSATTLAATSEAVAFGTAAGLDMDVMLEVLNASSGRSTATTDRFPRHVVTGSYAAGFSNTLMAKDVRLYLRAAQELRTARAVGSVTWAVWAGFAAAEPGADFTRVYPYLRDS